MKKLVFYGAGKRGKTVYNYLKDNGWEKIVYCFCDKNAKDIKMVDGVKVLEPDELEQEDVEYYIAVADESIRSEIIRKLGDKKIIDFDDLALILNVDKVKFNRDFVAFFHIDKMNRYFDSAEKTTDVFWGGASPFYRMFCQLDLSNVIELACGRGRHVPHYIDKSGEITLVDILDKNINYCKDRFKSEDKIKYYKNNGFDLRELESDCYTALFSYDAMVHFEMMDIYSYLNDIYRVLKNGAKVLIHHSNYGDDYKASFENGPGGRSYMTKDCFAYLAYRAGFEVIEQKVIDWGVKNLDCITLLAKSKS